MKKCKNCGQEFEDGANVCPVCGAADNGQSAKVCPNCKTEVSDNSNFCTNCGTPINGSAQSNNGDAQNNAGQNNFGGQNYRQPPYQPPMNYVPKSRLLAGLLGIFLGGLGVHNFYLGFTTRAVVQIVVTLITCGVGSIWGFIEGILIICHQINLDAYNFPLKDDC